MVLVYVSLAVIVGVYLGSHVSLPLAAVLPAIAAALFVALLGRRRRAVLLIALLLCAFLCGALRSGLVPTGDGLQPFVGQGDVEVIGVVVEEPDPSHSSTGLVCRVRELNGEEVSGTLLVRTTRFPSYRYGDVLRLVGELEEPGPFDGFDYGAYLARQGIFTTMYYPDEVERVGSGQGPPLLQAIHSLRQRLAHSLGASLSEPASGLAQALLLGLRSGIPEELYLAFQRSGTAHLLAISGLHMAIVAGILLSVSVALFGRRRPTYFLVTLGSLWLYALLAGMSPSVVRAAIMVSLFLFAAYVGRQRSTMTALAFAAALMVLVDPRVMWSVSFQLSFAAVSGLVLLAPVFQRWGQRTRAPAVVCDSFAYSLAAILGTLPLVAYYFGYVSLVGLPATFLMLPVLPAIICLSALVSVVGLWALPVAQAVGWVAWPFLRYMEGVAELFAALPWSSLDVGGVDVFWVWLYYGVLAALLLLSSRRGRLLSGAGPGVGRQPSRRLSTRWLLVPLSLVAVLVWAAVIAAPQGGRLTVSFLDVGQGDAILITAPQGQRVLVDGGPSPECLLQELGEALPFWERDIDLMVLTHAHDDHVTGQVEVLRRYQVDQVLYPESAGYESSAYAEWLALVEEGGIALVPALEGQRIELGGGASVAVLGPPEEPFCGTESDVDNNGVVLRVEMGEVSFLLAADLFQEGEEALLPNGLGLQSTVLKVAHHGSKTSSCPGFLAAVAPQVAVVSVGADNRFGHPADEVMVRLGDVVGEGAIYCTDERGTVTFTTDGTRLWVGAER